MDHLLFLKPYTGDRRRMTQKIGKAALSASAMANACCDWRTRVRYSLSGVSDPSNVACGPFMNTHELLSPPSGKQKIGPSVPRALS